MTRVTTRSFGGGAQAFIPYVSTRQVFNGPTDAQGDDEVGCHAGSL